MIACRNKRLIDSAIRAGMNVNGDVPIYRTKHTIRKVGIHTVLFNTNFTMNSGATNTLGLVERNFSYDGTNLTSFSNSAFSDYTTGAVVNIPFNATVDNYVLLSMLCQNGADVANINLFKIFSYA